MNAYINKTINNIVSEHTYPINDHISYKQGSSSFHLNFHAYQIQLVHNCLIVYFYFFHQSSVIGTKMFGNVTRKIHLVSFQECIKSSRTYLYLKAKAHESYQDK